MHLVEVLKPGFGWEWKNRMQGSAAPKRSHPKCSGLCSGSLVLNRLALDYVVERVVCIKTDSQD